MLIKTLIRSLIFFGKLSLRQSGNIPLTNTLYNQKALEYLKWPIVYPMLIL